MKKTVYSMVLLAGYLAFLVSCGNNTKKYALTSKTIKNSEKSISLNIKSNLPPNSTVLISVYRTFIMKGDTAKRAGTLFDKDVALQEGQLSIIVPISDSSWYADFQNQLKNNKLANFKPISSISDSIFVNVVFSPRRQKDETVLEKVGKNGENLQVDASTGDNKMGFNVLKKDTALLIPFENKSK